jgi:hypothetical protein
VNDNLNMTRAKLLRKIDDTREGLKGVTAGVLHEASRK